MYISPPRHTVRALHVRVCGASNRGRVHLLGPTGLLQHLTDFMGVGRGHLVQERCDLFVFELEKLGQKHLPLCCFCIRGNTAVACIR